MKNTGPPIGELPDARDRDVLARQRPSGICLLRPDPFGDVELHSAAECFIAQMRICDLRVRIVRDGHEPNEAEEQRPRCVPIEPVHVISSPKDRREQEGYQNSGSFGENNWCDFRRCQSTIFGARGYHRERWSRARVSHGGDHWPRLLPAPSPRLQHFATPFPMAKHRALSSNRSPCDLGHPATSLRSSTRRGLEGVLGLLPPDPGRLQSP